MAKTTGKPSDQQLIAAHIDPDINRYGGIADARTREGVPVWALIGRLRFNGGNTADAAEAYALPDEAVEGALAYYRRNKAYIDARLLLNTG